MNSQDKLNTLTELLKYASPEEIFANAKSIQQKLDDQKKREYNKRIEKARKNLIAAVANYVEVMCPDLKVTQEDLNAIEKELIELEKVINTTKQIPKTEIKNNKDTEIIFDFLKQIGAV